MSRAVTVYRGLATGHFLLAVAACLIVYAFPASGLWPILLSLIPLSVRLFVERPLFHYGLADGLLVIFLATALLGYWAAYDRTAAWMKLSLLVAGILLYYAISTQPETNLDVLAAFWFAFGVGVSLYFLLTLDFKAFPAKFDFVNQIGLKWMSIRPDVGWSAIQPSDTAAGIAIITSVYGLYFLAPDKEMRWNKLALILVLLGFGVVLSAVILATSRGALVALAATMGVLLVWRVIRRINSWKEKVYKLFPAGALLFIGLTALLLILPLGIWRTEFIVGENSILNRSELIRNGISISLGFPILGGGLDSFPGLFSQDILVSPYYSLSNSHNLFVDVSIEQGMVGGLAFLLLYSIGLWKIAAIISRGHPNRQQIFYVCMFSSIFIAMVHGLVDDYLYSGWWAALAFFPVGMSMLAIALEPAHEPVFKGALSFDRLSGRQLSKDRKVSSRGITLVVVILLVTVIGLSWNKLAAQWFANLGAVEMDRIELAGYPANKWDAGEHNEELQPVKILFIRSLSYDAANWIANYHLGLIEMSERNFSSASEYLAKAYQQRPWHRGAAKNLGYSYAWMGEIDKARFYLQNIPEARSEMGVYTWWWETQGRMDLSANASILSSELGRQ